MAAPVWIEFRFKEKYIRFKEKFIIRKIKMMWLKK